MFHSADSKSSTETKVGSPPRVRRTSWDVRSASTRSPTASSAAQSASSNGRVMRIGSTSRVTVIEKSKWSAGRLATPVIAAAER